MGVVLQQCGLGAVVLYSLISLNLPDVGTRAKVAACGRNPRMFAGSQPGPL